jgi:thiamine biosynthesis lipoprotein
MKNKRIKIILPLVVVVAIVAIGFMMGHKDEPYQRNSGFIFGTSYNITYQCADNHQADIEKVLAEVDASLSPFNDTSIITHVNRNEDVVLDNLFLDVFRLAQKINEDTEGAFDITVAPLVNAWGFGFKNGVNPDAKAIDSLRQVVGFQKVRLENNKVVKFDPRVMLDCSAIAKGYGVDVVANLLRKYGIKNFMVEIGGEVVTSGVNPERMPWRIGVTKPTDDSLSVNNELQTVINVTDKAMATSGNYRNFYYKGGRKYAHTIDPKTGYPVQHSILSATVITDDCATADAYATSFMVLGMEKARLVLDRHPEMMAYFIYSDDSGQNQVWFSPSLKDKIAQ